MSRSKKKKNIW